MDAARLVDPFSVPCRYCGAVAGQQCVNKALGGPLRRFVAHCGRFTDARKMREEAEAQ